MSGGARLRAYVNRLSWKLGRKRSTPIGQPFSYTDPDDLGPRTRSWYKRRPTAWVVVEDDPSWGQAYMMTSTESEVKVSPFTAQAIIPIYGQDKADLLALGSEWSSDV